MPADGSPPPLIRPVPRRPFNISLTSATPPDEDSPLTTPPPGQATAAGSATTTTNDYSPFLSPRLLDPRQQLNGSSAPSLAEPGSGTASGSISRAQSILNLTSPTLFGIYSPTTSGYYNEGDGTGAESSRDRPRVLDMEDQEQGQDDQAEEECQEQHQDEDQDGDQARAAAIERLKERLSSSSPPTSHVLTAAAPAAPVPSQPTPVLSLAARAFLLFVLGMGCGVMVSRLRDERTRAAFRIDQPPMGAGSGGAIGRLSFTSEDRRYAAFWGLYGVVLGSLLPWFDHFYDRAFGGGGRVSRSSPSSRGRRQHIAGSVVSEEAEGSTAIGAGSKPDTDWALVVRGVGAFAGIVFAIRKLPWASTMQVSLSLALVNPFLWYLIDRSKSGFLLASAVGVLGSAVIMSLDPDMMPAPTMGSSSSSGTFSSGSPSAAYYNNTSSDSDSHVLGGGYESRSTTVETGIWMLSVLFCSCVCFGNIGRRLALGTSASARGRWAGAR